MSRLNEYLETVTKVTKTEEARQLARETKDPDEFAMKAYDQGIKDSIIVHILINHYGMDKDEAQEMTIHGD